MRSKPLSSYGGLLLGMAFLGSAFPSSKWAVGQVHHEVAAFLRFGGGALLLVIATTFLPVRRPPSRRHVVHACLAGLVGVFGYNALFFWGVTLAPASDGSVIVPALAPVITTIVLLLAKLEPAGASRFLGLLLGLGGATMFFLATSSSLPEGSDRLSGDTIFVLGAAVWAAYTLMNRRLLSDVDPLRAVMFATIAGSVALGIGAAPDLADVQWRSLSLGFWLNAAWLSIGPTVAAYILYVRGIRDVGAATASAMMFTVPVFGTALSFVFLGESFTAAQATGGAVMLVGAYLAVTARQPLRPPKEPPVPALASPSDAGELGTAQPEDGDRRGAPARPARSAVDAHVRPRRVRSG